ncbi:sensor histidine kinase [Hyalangium rubrum]|uniref:histidine kinase n=1 Tax=Hyalangium rubrum TaxID=3103134 RepID=A0ABU5H002_9BACT|nr:ATP-binding protein [Hyalangium sp. s54d21]MDY7226108.1 PAS domain-containing protein [Hyalangium sp. s54d21]
MTKSAAAERRSIPPEPDSPLAILLLEDSPLDAELISARLEEGGLSFKLTRVDSHVGLNEALSGCRFDLILSDYNLPGFDGVAALSAAHLACPEVPFIFVSGALGEEKAIELLKRGATDYVLKDRLERLVPSVERALREAREKSDRRRAEEQLRERERTLSTLMGNLPGMVFRCNPNLPWLFEFASEGSLALTGWRPEDFYAGGEVTWASIMFPEDVKRLEPELKVALAERRPYSATFRIRTRQGEQRWVWVRSSAQYQPDGTIAFVEGFATDITQQKQAEEEVRQRTEFEQQLLGIVSHDLRNPLNAIMLGAATLLRREGLDDKSTNSVRRILGSAERATRMIRDLLDFTQVRLGGGIPVERKPLDLHAHAAQVLEELEHTHPDRKLELSQQGDTHGEWDPDRIAQVITNLVGNALKYSAPNTVVGVKTRDEGDTVVLEVHNWGEPIAVELMGNLFKPLSRGAAKVDMQTRSIGLGLYIVASIVRGHGGAISVSSTVEGGTLFSVRLPRSAPAGRSP